MRKPAGFVFTGFVAALIALSAAAAPACAAPQNPELAAHARENEDATSRSAALAMASLDIDVDITGDTAETTVTAQFLNAGNRLLEGQFAFDLPPGSAVTGYALDVGGRMIDGVLVGQRRARVTYEASVRRGIDPGLAEVTREGAFTTRVYPILASGTRTVRLRFVTPLDREKPLAIPLVVEKPIGAVSIRVRTDAAKAPSIQGPEGVRLKWRREAGDFVAGAKAERQTLSGALTVGPPAGPPVLVERHQNGDAFFEIDDAAPPPSTAAHPGRVRIYWDASRSHRDADLAAETALVTRYMDAEHPATVDLVAFHGCAARRTFQAPTGAAIAAALKDIEYEGGTSTRAALAAPLPAADACLFVSDGNATLDRQDAPSIACQTMTISSVAGANRAFLRALAQRNGGDVIDLTTETPGAAFARLTDRSPRVLGVTDAQGHAIAYAVLPSGPNRFRVVGRADAAGPVTVHLTRAADGTRTYDVDPAAAKPADTLGALWAARHIDDMRASDEPDQDALIDLSRRYSVASTAASFVVFENVGDYVAADVAPPSSAGEEIAAAYRAAKGQADAAAAAERAQRLEAMVAMWDEEKAWWNRRFDLHPPRAEHGGSRERATGGSTSSAPPPPPPPPPAPPPPAALAAPAARERGYRRGRRRDGRRG